MLNGGSAKTRSTELAATRGNSSRQSPGYNRSNSNVVLAPGVSGASRRSGSFVSPSTSGAVDFALGMLCSLVVAGRVRFTGPAAGRAIFAGVAVAVPLRSAAGGTGLVDAVLGELLVQGVAV